MTSRTRHSRALLTALACAAVLPACRVDRATIFEPEGDRSFDFAMGPPAVGDRALPGGRVIVTRTGRAGSTASGTIRVRLTNLQPLTSGVYQLFLGRQVGDTLRDVIPVRGTLRVIRSRTDEDDEVTVDTTLTDNASSTAAGGPNTVVEFTITEATLGSNPTLAGRNTLLVSMQAAETATPPDVVSPLYAVNFTVRAFGPAPDTVKLADTTNLVFGDYSPRAADRYAFQAVGRGRGGVRGNILVIDDTLLARPPRGFYYAAFAIRTDSLDRVDTLYLGELTAPFPNRGQSLRDADITAIPGLVFDRPRAIAAASLRFEADSGAFVRPMGNVDIVVVLVSKFAPDGSLPPNRILVGTLPTIVTTPPPPGTN